MSFRMSCRASSQGNLMRIIDRLRAAGVCLSLGAGVVSSSPGLAASLPKDAVPVAAADAAAKVAPGAFDDERIRKLLAEGQDPAVSLVSIHKRQGAFSLHLAHEAKELPDPAPFIAEVARSLLRQGQVLHRHGIPVEGLVLSVFVPELLDDGQGGVKRGSGRMQVLSLVVPEKDWQNVNWPSLDHRVMLEVAGVSFSPAGRLAALQFCKHKADADAAPLFCAAAASGRRKEPMSVLFGAMAPETAPAKAPGSSGR